MKSSTSPLDPMPSQLIKDCLTPLAPLIIDIINSSLTSGIVRYLSNLQPSLLSSKKPGLDPEDPNNYRPISNLTFLSKLLERAVANQLKIHLLSNNLYETFQSGFRTHHSTETALLKVTNDLLLSSDSGSLTILLLLDLSAAFDTVNHSILLNRLESIGITNTALSWFKSYLSDRFHYITINQHKSHTTPVLHGVPQGSVLGPILFILYMLPLGHIIRRHGLKFHCYADDIQLYITTKTISPAILSTLTCCLMDIKDWMNHNFLKLNSNKTEIIIFGPKSSLSTCQNFTLCIDGHSVTPSPLVRNLGIYLDPTLSFKSHINHIVKTSFFHLRNIARLRPTLPTPAAETLIHAFITSRLDYCNSILYGLPSTALQKLQYVQNSAARMLTRSPIRQHITPVLRQLHWLPIKQRIHFKILLITYKALNNLAPPYLSDLLHRHSPARQLRSADANLLTQTTSTKYRTRGDRAFAVAAPTLWNSLPLTIRNSESLHSFKRHLKTHLFQVCI
uniref:Reverse transcriptase domain-containing protein n=1 Tax=Astyanax mexicanus TaxID=7994 RepID=A0A3B1IDG0_ASTMX